MENIDILINYKICNKRNAKNCLKCGPIELKGWKGKTCPECYREFKREYYQVNKSILNAKVKVKRQAKRQTVDQTLQISEQKKD